MEDHGPLLDTLPALQRMALAYCPAPARVPTLALFAFDARLASLLRNSAEPMLAQLRLSWWREMLSVRSADWPRGEPLLTVLRSWSGELAPLVGLVDGWEAMTAPTPLPGKAMADLAHARGEAFAALCRIVGVSGSSDTASSRAQAWALADIGARLTHPTEREVASGLVHELEWQAGGLPREMRPLAVLHGLAARSTRRGVDLGQGGLRAFVVALRLGLLGR